MSTYDLTTYLALVASAGFAAGLLIRQKSVKANEGAGYFALGCAWLIVTVSWIVRTYEKGIPHPILAVVIGIVFLLGIYLSFRASRRAAALR